MPLLALIVVLSAERRFHAKRSRDRFGIVPLTPFPPRPPPPLQIWYIMGSGGGGGFPTPALPLTVDVTNFFWRWGVGRSSPAVPQFLPFVFSPPFPLPSFHVPPKLHSRRNKKRVECFPLKFFSRGGDLDFILNITCIARKVFFILNPPIHLWR